MQKELEQSTKLLAKLVKSELSILAKVEIIEQIFHNLKFLKKELPKKDYSEKFEKMETSLNKIINDLTDPKFVKEVVDKITALDIFEKKVK